MRPVRPEPRAWAKETRASIKRSPWRLRGTSQTAKKYGKVSEQQRCFRRLPVLWPCPCDRQQRGRMGMLPRGHAEPCPGLWVPASRGVRRRKRRVRLLKLPDIPVVGGAHAAQGGQKYLLISRGGGQRSQGLLDLPAGDDPREWPPWPAARPPSPGHGPPCIPGGLWLRLA